MASEENMVLRTVYLPKELDRRLRSLAFRLHKSKGELMRDLIIGGLEARSEVPFAEEEKVQPTAASRVRFSDAAPVAAAAVADDRSPHRRRTQSPAAPEPVAAEPAPRAARVRRYRKEARELEEAAAALEAAAEAAEAPAPARAGAY